MGVSVEIIADSVGPGGRLTTAIWKYPRWIHSEVMTHRALSRNAASSRAIPVSKTIAEIKANPAMPVAWGKNEKGMQASENLGPSVSSAAEEVWRHASSAAIGYSSQLSLDMNVHKQIANRILEPWMHMTTLVSATEWENFFALRVSRMAQPEFQALAVMMLRAYLDSRPVAMQRGQWHIPFDPGEEYDLQTRLSAACGRCARVSYKNQDGVHSVADDLRLFDRLVGAQPRHMSPLEHVAECREGWYGNFRGWKQYRKQYADECVRGIDLRELLARYERGEA